MQSGRRKVFTNLSEYVVQVYVLMSLAEYCNRPTTQGYIDLRAAVLMATAELVQFGESKAT